MGGAGRGIRYDSKKVTNHPVKSDHRNRFLVPKYFRIGEIYSGTVHYRFLLSVYCTVLQVPVFFLPVLWYFPAPGYTLVVDESSAIFPAPFLV